MLEGRSFLLLSHLAVPTIPVLSVSFYLFAFLSPCLSAFLVARRYVSSRARRLDRRLDQSDSRRAKQRLCIYDLAVAATSCASFLSSVHTAPLPSPVLGPPCSIPFPTPCVYSPLPTFSDFAMSVLRYTYFNIRPR